MGWFSCMIVALGLLASYWGNERGSPLSCTIPSHPAYWRRWEPSLEIYVSLQGCWWRSGLCSQSSAVRRDPPAPKFSRYIRACTAVTAHDRRGRPIIFFFCSRTCLAQPIDVPLHLCRRPSAHPPSHVLRLPQAPTNPVPSSASLASLASRAPANLQHRLRRTRPPAPSRPSQCQPNNTRFTARPAPPSSPPKPTPCSPPSPRPPKPPAPAPTRTRKHAPSKSPCARCRAWPARANAASNARSLACCGRWCWDIGGRGSASW